jgi:crotonobetainyl-CoA:carnitine CoA-transferase CaiB-like acyl-CoA transferase
MAMLLGDFGAEVIKVEPPGGESSRVWGSARFGAGDMSGLFLALNRNKASVTIDLKSLEGKAAVYDLVLQADVVLESFKPGVADRLGIGYERLSELKPDLVYCSVSGFGQTGPLREQPGYDQLLQAFSGHMSITGEPGRPSVRIGPSVLALRVRDQTGVGQHVETSLYDSSLHLITHYIADYTGSGRLPGKAGGGFAFLAPYGMYQARDRELYLGVGTEVMFEKLCEALGASHLPQDSRFADNPARVAHREELDAELAPLFATEDAAHWVEVCMDLGIPASIVKNVSEVVEEPQALAREMIIETGIDGVRTAGLPIKLSSTPATVRRQPPSLGADNDRILGPPQTAG